MPRPAIAIIGGGIAGLAAAYELSHHACTVVLYEASPRLGGKVRSGVIGGRTIDVGPDAFIARTPAAVQLCEELGLGAQLIAPAKGSAYVYARGELRPLPAGLVLGIPTDLDALAASGIVSPRGVEQARTGLGHRFDPARDESVGAVVRRAIGDEAVDYLVDPMVGGINAGHVDRLSISAATPQFAAAAARHDDLLEGLRAQGAGGNVLPDTPVFQSLPGGVSQLTAELGAFLDACPAVEVHREAPARLGPVDAGAVHVIDPAGQARRFDAAVLALPAAALADLVAPAVPDAAAELGQIPYASVALTTFRYARSDVPGRLDKGGFLVPRVEGLLMTACTWFSAKWPHTAAPGEALLRVSAGRIDDERIATLDDASLVDHLRRDLTVTMGIEAPPLETVVTRYARSFPQYEPGHLARVGRIESSLRQAGPMVATGAAFRGIGIPACVHQGRHAALDALRIARGGQ